MKMTRRQFKSAVTKKINKIEEHLAEDDKSNLAKETEALKKVFTDFEDIHNRVFSMIGDLDQQDVGDKYFFDVQDGYIKAMKKASSKLGEMATAKIESTATNHHCASSISSVPRLHLKPFTGDPLKYHSFIATFEQAVGKCVHDDGTKLLHLLQFTEGEALQSIQLCTMPGS